MFVGREAIISAIKERHKAMGQRHERVAFHLVYQLVVV